MDVFVVETNIFHEEMAFILMFYKSYIPYLAWRAKNGWVYSTLLLGAFLQLKWLVHHQKSHFT